MILDINKAVEALGLRISEDDSALLAAREHRYAEAVVRTRAQLDDPACGPDYALLHILCTAAAGAEAQLDGRVAGLFVQWLRREDVTGNVRRRLYLGPVLAEISPTTLEQLLLSVARSPDDATSTVVGLSGILPGDARRRILQELARHPSDDIRAHFFALLGQHRRLSPPGSIGLAFNAEPAFEYILSIGMTDANPRVRERAVAAAYGLGLVGGVREYVMRLLSDPDVAVRQYAIIALGVLDDEVSRNVLARLLRSDVVEETTSSIWAAARRPDLIRDVLAMIGDARPWVNNEVLEAFAEVSVPLTDEQIADLDRRTNSAKFAQLRDRHIGRTRLGQPERGPDNRVDIVLKR